MDVCNSRSLDEFKISNSHHCQGPLNLLFSQEVLEFTIDTLWCQTLFLIAPSTKHCHFLDRNGTSREVLIDLLTCCKIDRFLYLYTGLCEDAVVSNITNMCEIFADGNVGKTYFFAMDFPSPYRRRRQFWGCSRRALPVSSFIMRVLGTTFVSGSTHP